MENANFVNENGEKLDVSVIGFFTIPDLEKEYIMYGIVNEKDDDGKVLLGEVIREDDNIKILGILSSEKELVVAYFNEVSNQIGGEK
ncbi:MAG: hypothetical protein E7172_01410 [Firmicutes bacterium]|nr:hypothetical protein [Bacillota bacterium]